MYIHHIAIWTHQLENLKDFYTTYFGATAGPKYTNPAKRFESYFLAFANGAKIEIMRQEGRSDGSANSGSGVGFAHLAFAVGSEAQVDALTNQLEQDGLKIASRPRRTGDGYYESVILDPDDNLIEITAGS